MKTGLLKAAFVASVCLAVLATYQVLDACADVEWISLEQEDYVHADALATRIRLRTCLQAVASVVMGGSLFMLLRRKREPEQL